MDTEPKYDLYKLSKPGVFDRFHMIIKYHCHNKGWTTMDFIFDLSINSTFVSEYFRQIEYSIKEGYIISGHVSLNQNEEKLVFNHPLLFCHKFF